MDHSARFPELGTLPELETPEDALLGAFPGLVNGRQLRKAGPFLRLAEATLMRLRERSFYEIDKPLPPGTTSGYAYLGTDARRIITLASSIRRFALNAGVLPDMLSPRNVTEKLLVWKMFGAIPDGPPADKLLADRFIPGDRIDLVSVTKRPWISPRPELPGDDIVPPGRYYLKANFGAGNNLPVTFPLDPSRRRELEAEVGKWFGQPHMHGFWAGEWWYQQISPRIYLEESFASEGEDSSDWKLWMIAGKLHSVQVDHDRSRNHVQKVYTPDFQLTEHEIYYPSNFIPDPKPDRFDDMVAVAEGICRSLEFARVDFFLVDGALKLGEITLCPFGAKTPMRSPELDASMGRAWTGTRLFPG